MATTCSARNAPPSSRRAASLTSSGARMPTLNAWACMVRPPCQLLGPDRFGDDAPAGIVIEETLGVAAEDLGLRRRVHLQSLAQEPPALGQPRRQATRLAPVGVAAIDDAIGPERLQERRHERGPHREREQRP